MENKSEVSRLTPRNHTRTRQARRPSPLLTSLETYAIKKRPDFSSVNVQQLLRDVDVPDFLDDLAQHPYFASLLGSINPLTEFNFWDSYLVRIPTSRFAPEPRIARIHAISGLIAQKKTPKLDSEPRSDAIFYLPRNDPAFDHEDAKLHGALTTHSPATTTNTPLVQTIV